MNVLGHMTSVFRSQPQLMLAATGGCWSVQVSPDTKRPYVTLEVLSSDVYAESSFYRFEEYLVEVRSIADEAAESLNICESGLWYWDSDHPAGCGEWIIDAKPASPPVTRDVMIDGQTVYRTEAIMQIRTFTPRNKTGGKSPWLSTI